MLKPDIAVMGSRLFVLKLHTQFKTTCGERRKRNAKCVVNTANHKTTSRHFKSNPITIPKTIKIHPSHCALHTKKKEKYNN